MTTDNQIFQAAASMGRSLNSIELLVTISRTSLRGKINVCSLCIQSVCVAMCVSW